MILAHDDYEGKEQVYGFTQRLEEAQTIAEEAVKIGSRRLEKRVAIETDFKVGVEIEALWSDNRTWYKATIKNINKKGEFGVKWTDGGQFSWGLELHQIRNITDYNKFGSARIVDLDTQEEVEEFGMYNDCRSDSW